MLARVVERLRWLLRELGVPLRERDLMPERRYVVELDAERIAFLAPDGAREEIAIDALERAEARTDDTGPWGMDLWWCLEGGGRRMCTPNGATGEAALMEFLKNLPGFDRWACGEAVRSTRVACFTLWERDARRP